MATQTDIGFETGRKLWYVENYTANRQFLGVQMVKNSNIKLKDVIVDTYAWKHEKYANSSQCRVRFFDDSCTIRKHDSIAESIEVQGHSKFEFIKLPAGDIEVKANLEDMDWTMRVQNKDYVTRNFVGKVTAHLLQEKKRFIIEQPKNVLYSKEITLIDPNLEITHG